MFFPLRECQQNQSRAVLWQIGRIRRLSLLRRLNYRPLKSVPEVSEAFGTNPVVVILCRIALVNRIGAAHQADMDPAETTVIVIPIGILLVLPVLPVDKSDSLQVSFLPHEPPVILFDHLSFTINHPCCLVGWGHGSSSITIQ
jgi:hypothetical protein